MLYSPCCMSWVDHQVCLSYVCVDYLHISALSMLVTVTAAIKCFRKAFRKWMNDMIDEPQLLSGTSRSDDGHGNLHCNKYDDDVCTISMTTNILNSSRK